MFFAAATPPLHSPVAMAGAVLRAAAASRTSAHVRRQAARTLATPSGASGPDASRVPPYQALLAQLERVRAILGRPLTLAEKVLYAHVRDPVASFEGAGSDPGAVRGSRYLQLSIDRLAMQGAYCSFPSFTMSSGRMYSPVLSRCVRADGAAAVHDVRPRTYSHPCVRAL